MIVNTLGLVTAALFFSIGLLHLYWALSGRRASPSVIPTQNGKLRFTPTPALTLLVALALFVATLIVLGTLGYGRFGLHARLFKIGIWGLVLVFSGRAVGDFHWVGFFKTIRNTPFARNDTHFYSPLCIAIAVACATLGASL